MSIFFSFDVFSYTSRKHIKKHKENNKNFIKIDIYMKKQTFYL